MRHFLININYTAPTEKIDEVLEGHREFLQTGYDKGIILMSGPRNPRRGGVIIARANDLEDIEEFFLQDPYKTLKFADYEFIEFNPVKYQEFLTSWVKED